MEYRIYVDGALRNICDGSYAFLCNFNKYRSSYGNERVEYKTFHTSPMDDEKLKWLESVGEDINEY